jgi:hypothetical protein
MDLPDDIIFVILNNVEVFHSFVDVKTQLNYIVHDLIFTTKIILMKATDLTLTLPNILSNFYLIPKRV